MPFLFILTASFIGEKHFPNSFHLTLSTPSQEDFGSISQWGNNAKGTTMLGLMTSFSNTLFSIKVVLRAISKSANIVFSRSFCICQSTQKFMLKSPQLWAPLLQDSGFQHPFTPTLALKVVSENANNNYSEG